MAVGNTITDSLADSIPTMIASARIVREFAGVALFDHAYCGRSAHGYH